MFKGKHFINYILGAKNMASPRFKPQPFHTSLNSPNNYETKMQSLAHLIGLLKGFLR